MKVLRGIVVAAAVAVASIVVWGAENPVDARSRGVTEYDGLPDSSVPGSMVTGPDGRLWFSDLDNGVGAITTSGFISRYGLPNGTLDIALGPDGALWATGTESLISRVTTSGSATNFSMPATGATPGASGIAAGPDGNIWYSRTPGVVGKMTPAGSFTEYSVPVPSPDFESNPGAITAGPDGAMWFVESWGGRIGRVTTDGTFTMHSVGAVENPELRDIVLGPDNNLWFIETGAGSVGRLTPSGTVNTFSLPSQQVSPGFDTVPHPYTLGFGPDGSLWAGGSAGLWQIATNGSITGTYEIGAMEHAFGIAGGADGRLWYTQPGYGDPKIGALTPNDVPTGEFTAVTPARVLDTRDGTGRDGVTAPLGPNASFDVQIAGRGGVPASGVSAVVLNATVTDPTAGSFVTISPAGSPRPVLSNLNFGPGQTVPNLVTVQLGSGGRLNVYNAVGNAHVVFDVVGYYSSSTGPFGSRYRSVDPSRALDTRDGTGGVPAAPVGPDSTLRFQVTGRGGVPTSGVTGVVMNVTVTNPTSGGYLTVFPDGVARPLASNLNFGAGQTIPNLVTVGVSSAGYVNFYNPLGNTHVLADVVGYYTTDVTTNEGRFVALPPQRILDTRETELGPLPADVRGVVQVGGAGGVPPADVGAVVMNVTATDATDFSFLSVFPDHLCDVPTVSNLNFGPHQVVPNLVITRLSPEVVPEEPVPGHCPVWGMSADFYNARGEVHLVLDVFGYFTSPRFSNHQPGIAAQSAPAARVGDGGSSAAPYTTRAD